MIEEGLHYHKGYRYVGQYKDGLEKGLWTITKTDVLVSTMDFKEGFQDGELKIYNEDGEIICLVVFDKGEMCETPEDIVNVGEMMRVLDLKPTDNPNELWKIGDDGNGGVFKGEGYLMEKKNKE